LAAVSRGEYCSVHTVKLWRGRFTKERISGLEDYLGKAVTPGNERFEARIIDWILSQARRCFRAFGSMRSKSGSPKFRAI
jgi:hypothetical protein